jgi:hypothetical protein
MHQLVEMSDGKIARDQLSAQLLGRDRYRTFVIRKEKMFPNNQRGEQKSLLK